MGGSFGISHSFKVRGLKLTSVRCRHVLVDVCIIHKQKKKTIKLQREKIFKYDKNKYLLKPKTNNKTKAAAIGYRLIEEPILNAWHNHTCLIHIFAVTVFVRGFTYFIAFKKQNLRDTFIGVNFCR